MKRQTARWWWWTAALCAALVLTACTAQTDTDDAASVDSAGSGQTVERQQEMTQEPQIPDIDICTAEMASDGTYTAYEYDESGNLTLADLYQGDNSIERITYEYDGKGRCTGETHTLISAEGESTPDCTVELTYNARGDLIERAVFEPDGTAGERTTYDSDADGNVLRETNYDADGNELNYTQSEYEGELLQRETLNDAPNSLVYVKTYEYDTDGNAIRTTTTDSDGMVSSSTEAQYDEAGRQINLTQFDQNGNLTSHESREYDESGNLIRLTLADESGRVYQQIDYTWTALEDYLAGEDAQ